MVTLRQQMSKEGGKVMGAKVGVDHLVRLGHLLHLTEAMRYQITGNF
jgi:hypothetical protein